MIGAAYFGQLYPAGFPGLSEVAQPPDPVAETAAEAQLGVYDVTHPSLATYSVLYAGGGVAVRPGLSTYSVELP